MRACGGCPATPPGLARAQGGLAPLAQVGGQADVAAQPRERLTVVYGSQTGNAKRVAEALAAKFEAEGLPVRLLRADAYPTRELKDEHYLAIVISTQGDGDPPDDARALVEFLDGKRAPKLPALRFSVPGPGRLQLSAVLRHRPAHRRPPRGPGRAALGGPRRCRPRHRHRVHAVGRAGAGRRQGSAQGTQRAAGHGHPAAPAPRRTGGVDTRAPVHRRTADQPARHRSRLREGHPPHRAVAGRRRPGLRTGRRAGRDHREPVGTGRGDRRRTRPRWRHAGHRRRGHPAPARLAGQAPRNHPPEPPVRRHACRARRQRRAEPPASHPTSAKH